MGVKDLLNKVLNGFLDKSTNVAGVTTTTRLTKAVVDFSYWEHELLYVIAVLVFEDNKIAELPKNEQSINSSFPSPSSPPVCDMPPPLCDVLSLNTHPVNTALP